jgi:mRNA interferase MazF
MVIRQGGVYWVDLGIPFGSEAGYRRPCVVIQNDIANRSRLRTVILCPLTSNLDRAAAPGNVLIEAGEAHLSEPSVINVAQVISVDKRRLEEWIGDLSPRRVRQVLRGLGLLVEPHSADF